MVFHRGRRRLTPIKSGPDNAHPMTSRYDAGRARAAGSLFDHSAAWLAAAAATAIATGWLARHGLPVYVAALLIGSLALASILASLRFYHPRFSWIGWLVAVALAGLVIQPVRVGVISPFTAMYAYALAAVGVFGVIFVGRERLKKWVTAR